MSGDRLGHAWVSPAVLTSLLAADTLGLLAGAPAAGLSGCALFFAVVLLVKAAPVSLASTGVALAVGLLHGWLRGGSSSTPVLLVAWVTGVAYAALVGSWWRARRAELRDGLRPAVGVTGAAVWRRQAVPATTPLPTTATPDDGSVPGCVLLHGLGATGASLQGLADQLAQRGLRTLAPDLLGHGRSRGIGTSFGLAPQAHAVVRLISGQGLDGLLLVGHSYGCAVAAEVATARPDLFTGVVLVCPPAFPDEAKARERLSERSWLARQTLRGRRSAAVVCGVMCLVRAPLAALAPRVAPDLPKAAAEAGVAHTYPAYRDALQGLFSPRLRDWLASPAVPTTVLLAADDETVPLSSFAAVTVDPRVPVQVLPGDHLLPLTQPAPVAAAIADVYFAARARASGAPRCTGRSPAHPRNAPG